MITRLVVLVLCCVSSGAFADGVPIKIENPWLQALPPVAEATAAYMKIRNLGEKPLELIGASSPIATTIEPMITTKQVRNGQEILGMEAVAEFAIPPGGTLELKPGGNHLMMMGLTAHPKEGERVKLTVRFAPGDQRIDLEIPVLREQPQ
jgi:periplasmic copper chaperone A